MTSAEWSLFLDGVIVGVIIGVLRHHWWVLRHKDRVKKIWGE